MKKSCCAFIPANRHFTIFALNLSFIMCLQHFENAKREENEMHFFLSLPGNPGKKRWRVWYHKSTLLCMKCFFGCCKNICCKFEVAKLYKDELLRPIRNQWNWTKEFSLFSPFSWVFWPMFISCPFAQMHYKKEIALCSLMQFF